MKITLETKNLFLDDQRVPKDVYPDPQNWDQVNGYKDFCEFFEAIKSKKQWIIMPMIVSFDMLLNSAETGFDCAEFLSDFCVKNDISLPQINCHSTMPKAAEYIRQGLLSYAKKKNTSIDIIRVNHNS